MNVHVESVHEEKKPFKCDICDFACAQKQSIIRHVAKKHEAKKHEARKL